MGIYACRERLVMAVPEAEHSAVILLGFLPLDFHEAE